jgi:hypothetical protein
MTSEDRDSTSTPLERDLFAAVEPTIADAEAHLGVPHGTLADIRHDSDYCNRQDACNHRAAAQPGKSKCRLPGPCCTRRSIIRPEKRSRIFLSVAHWGVAGSFGSEERTDFGEQRNIHSRCIELRNFYAHNVSNITKTIYQASAELDRQTDGFNLLRDLLAYSSFKKSGPFLDLDDACEKVEQWRIEYNEVRPHSAIGDRTPLSLIHLPRPQAEATNRPEILT